MQKNGATCFLHRGDGVTPWRDLGVLYIGARLVSHSPVCPLHSLHGRLSFSSSQSVLFTRVTPVTVALFSSLARLRRALLYARLGPLVDFRANAMQSATAKMAIGGET